MKLHSHSGNPLVTWTDFTWKLGELMVASGQVIGHRVVDMAGAGPSLRKQRELSLMSSEKFEAAAESTREMCWGLMRLNVQLATTAMKQMLGGAAAMMPLASSRTLAESIGHQTKLMSDAVTNSVAAASQISNSTARLARRTLKPVHTRAQRNAKRLRRR